jgi:hypothetical protein
VGHNQDMSGTTQPVEPSPTPIDLSAIEKMIDDDYELRGDVTVLRLRVDQLVQLHEGLAGDVRQAQSKATGATVVALLAVLAVALIAALHRRAIRDLRAGLAGKPPVQAEKPAGEEGDLHV